MVYQSSFSGEMEPVEAGLDAAVLGQKFFSRKLELLLSRSSTDWMRTTHIIEKNPLNLKSADCRC